MNDNTAGSATVTRVSMCKNVIGQMPISTHERAILFALTVNNNNNNSGEKSFSIRTYKRTLRQDRAADYVSRVLSVRVVPSTRSNF